MNTNVETQPKSEVDLRREPRRSDAPSELARTPGDRRVGGLPDRRGRGLDHYRFVRPQK